MEIAHLQTPVGNLQIKGNSEGVSVISFVETPLPSEEIIPDSLQTAVLQLQEYFSKKRTQFSFQLNLQGTDFQQKVWQELLAIPFGKTTSYQQVANRLGDPKVIRAAASANGKNPVAIVVPCHRVIGSDGSLTGYAGGLHRKKWLLAHESPAPQTSLFE